MKRFIDQVGSGAYTAMVGTTIFAIWAAAMVAFGAAAIFILAFLWKAVDLITSSATYETIFHDAQAAATLVGVLLTGLFGFGGIIITNALSARSARAQSDRNEEKARRERKENEHLARQLQLDIAKGLDSRIASFADAFAKYHADTIEVLRSK